MSLLNLFAFIFFAASVASAAPTGLSYSDPTWDENNIPITVYGDNYEGWTTDLYLGSLALGSSWYDAPQKETGYVRTGYCIEGPDDKTYCWVARADTNKLKVIEVDETTGTARLFLDSTGTFTGPTEEVIGGIPFYNSYDDKLYLAGYGYCVRRVDTDEDGTRSVALVAGNCETSGHENNTGSAARFGYFGSAAADGIGNIYVVETDDYIRKIDVNGVVTTFTNITRSDSPTLWTSLNAGRNMIHLGESPTELYLMDQYGNSAGNAVLVFNPTTEVITKVQGVDPRVDTYNRSGTFIEKDGPALTHSRTRGGGRGQYSQFYKSAFIYGNDNVLPQRYDSVTEWVTTIGESLRPGVSAESLSTQELIEIIHTEGFSLEQNFPNRAGGNNITTVQSSDSRGGIFFVYGPGTNLIHRAYNTQLGGTQ